MKRFKYAALLEKISKKRDDTINPGFWEGAKGLERALSTPKAIGLVRPEVYALRKKRMREHSKRFAGTGALVGGGIGAPIGYYMGKVEGGRKGKWAIGGAALGAVLGTILGLDIGVGKGITVADREYLKTKGIDLGWGGLSARFNREAAKKYLTKNKKRR